MAKLSPFTFSQAWQWWDDAPPSITTGWNSTCWGSGQQGIAGPAKYTSYPDGSIGGSGMTGIQFLGAGVTVAPPQVGVLPVTIPGMGAAVELVGNPNSGNYSLTNAFAPVQPSAWSPLGIYLTPGKYLVMVTLAITGCTAGDQVEANVLNTATGVVCPNSAQWEQATSTGEITLDMTFLLSVPANGYYVVQAQNFTGARGSVVMARSKVDALQVAQAASVSAYSLGVTGFTPGYGLYPTTITITGYGFTFAKAVYIGGVSVPFTINGDSQITCSLPSGLPVSASVALQVGSANGVATASTVFYCSATPAYGIKGYAFGSLSPATVYKLTFATSTTGAVSTGALGASLNGSAGVAQQGMTAYVAGGTTGSGASSAVVAAYATAFGSDATSSASTANLPTATCGIAGVSQGSANGYLMGGAGTSGAGVAAAYALVYSSATTSALSTANLSQPRAQAVGLSAGTAQGKGYVLGGASSYSTLPFYETADKIVFASSTTAAASTANLTVSEEGANAVSDGQTYGYSMGGYESGSGSCAVVDKITFATDTSASDSTAALPQVCCASASVSQGAISGWILGGYGTSAAITTAQQLNYSTGTTSSVAGAALGAAQEAATGCSDYGY